MIPTVYEVICDQSTRMAERGIQPQFVVIGWETALHLARDERRPGELFLKPPVGVATPAGYLTVIVDQFRIEGVWVHPSPVDALRMAPVVG